MTARPIFRTVLAAALLGALTGCASGPAAPGPLYPVELRQTRTLDVQVFRSAKHVQFTNTTAEPFGESRVWLNARYSTDISGAAPGESITLPLDSFVDEHGDIFRGGGFFATEIPERLVLAQLETLDENRRLVMLGLVVVKGEDE